MGSRGCPEERQILVLGGEQEEGTFLLQLHPLGPQQHKVPPRASWLCHPKTCKLQPHGGATANGEQACAVSRCHNLLTWRMGREERLSKVSSKNSSHLLLKITAGKGVACGGSLPDFHTNKEPFSNWDGRGARAPGPGIRLVELGNACASPAPQLTAAFTQRMRQIVLQSPTSEGRRPSTPLSASDLGLGWQIKLEQYSLKLKSVSVGNTLDSVWFLPWR